MKELRARGLVDVLLFVTGGLAGVEEAIHRVYPRAEWQYSILHKLRAAQAQVKRRDLAAVLANLKLVYRASSKDRALEELRRFTRTWQDRYPPPPHRFLVERLGGFAPVLRLPRALVALPEEHQPHRAVLPGVAQEHQGTGPQVSGARIGLQAGLPGKRAEGREVEPEAAGLCRSGGGYRGPIRSKVPRDTEFDTGV